MKKREFHKFLLSASALGLVELPLGMTQAHAQGTGGVKGGTLNSNVQPEPPILNLTVSQPTPK